MQENDLIKLLVDRSLELFKHQHNGVYLISTLSKALDQAWKEVFLEIARTNCLAALKLELTPDIRSKVLYQLKRHYNLNY